MAVTLLSKMSDWIHRVCGGALRAPLRGHLNPHTRFKLVGAPYKTVGDVSRVALTTRAYSKGLIVEVIP